MHESHIAQQIVVIVVAFVAIIRWTTQMVFVQIRALFIQSLFVWSAVGKYSKIKDKNRMDTIFTWQKTANEQTNKQMGLDLLDRHHHEIDYCPDAVQYHSSHNLRNSN